ncbi:MAG: response regulator [Patescibacteria group bacterium]
MAETKKPTLFLVDDDKFLIDMYSLKFSKNGFDVQHSFDADDALKKLRDGMTPDILLLDVIMPGMDGLDLLAQIRKEKLVPSTVIIMLTNQGLADDIERAKKLEVDGYIVKAMTIPSEVLAEVQSIYNKVTEHKSPKKNS